MSRPGTPWPWTARSARAPRPARKKVHLLAAVTHTPGIVIAQDKVAKTGKANEITHFKPLLAPLPLDGAVVTSDAMQANRDNALFLRTVKNAHYLWPVLGNQPTLNETLNALPWQDTPVAAATCEITRGRIGPACAMSAVLYRPRSGQRWEEISLDLMANPRSEK